LGFYDDQGIKIQILIPIADNYLLTPGKKLVLGMAAFAIALYKPQLALITKRMQSMPLPYLPFYKKTLAALHL
jgi:hypothetical protein